MPIRTLLVDGYNFIGAVSTLRPDRLEASRKHLLDRAAQYVVVRGHRVTVVFDGAASGDIQAPRWARRGVREVFSRPGEKADAWIVDEAAALHGECVVVTNDRAVAQGCSRSGAVVLGCEAFDEAMRRAVAEGGQGPRTEAGGRRRFAPAGGAPGPRCFAVARRRGRLAGLCVGREAAGEGPGRRPAPGRGARGKDRRGEPPARTRPLTHPRGPRAGTRARLAGLRDADAPRPARGHAGRAGRGRRGQAGRRPEAAAPHGPREPRGAPSAERAEGFVAASTGSWGRPAGRARGREVAVGRP